MGICSKIFFEQVLKVYGGFEGVKELMDVAGGNGTSLRKIVSIYPHIRGINFDLPHVIAYAPMCPDVKYVVGDMFESLPNAQTILFKWILHDWDDKRCMKLLINCWKALPYNGKVIVVEFAISQGIEDTQNVIAFDFFMMVTQSGGKERMKTEFDDLTKVAGFAKTNFFPIGQGIFVMEFFKRAPK